jgi:hypothetical protein
MQDILSVGMPLVGVVIGFGMREAMEWRQRKRRRRAHFAALNAEIEFCRETARTLIDAGIAAPLYRFPMTFYEHSMPELLRLGLFDDSEAKALARYYAQVESLNRGLDQAHEFYRGDNDKLMRDEYSRCQLKAKELLQGNKDEVTYYDRARQAVAAHYEPWARSKK